MNPFPSSVAAPSAALPGGLRPRRWLQLTVVGPDGLDEGPAMGVSASPAAGRTLKVDARAGQAVMRSQGSLWITPGPERRRSPDSEQRMRVQPLDDSSICLTTIAVPA